MSDAVIAQKNPLPIEVEAGKTYWWCACGQSKRQPFCDGSHKGSAFNPVKWTAEAAGRKFFCGCKATRGQPFCDGSHKALKGRDPSLSHHARARPGHPLWRGLKKDGRVEPGHGEYWGRGW